MGILAAAEGATTLTTALDNIGTVVTKAVSIITGNEVLMIIFCGCLLGVGFRVVSQAKRAAK